MTGDLVSRPDVLDAIRNLEASVGVHDDVAAVLGLAALAAPGAVPARLSDRARELLDACRRGWEPTTDDAPPRPVGTYVRVIGRPGDVESGVDLYGTQAVRFNGGNVMRFRPHEMAVLGWPIGARVRLASGTYGVVEAEPNDVGQQRVLTDDGPSVASRVDRMVGFDALAPAPEPEPEPGSVAWRAERAERAADRPPPEPVPTLVPLRDVRDGEWFVRAEMAPGYCRPTETGMALVLRPKETT